MNMDVNWFAVIAVAFSSFLLGGIWYGDLLAKAHQKAEGMSEGHMSGGNKVLTFGG